MECKIISELEIKLLCEKVYFDFKKAKEILL